LRPKSDIVGSGRQIKETYGKGQGELRKQTSDHGTYSERAVKREAPGGAVVRKTLNLGAEKNGNGGEKRYFENIDNNNISNWS
jgi:hypothetical protein